MGDSFILSYLKVIQEYPFLASSGIKIGVIQCCLSIFFSSSRAACSNRSSADSFQKRCPKRFSSHSIQFNRSLFVVVFSIICPGETGDMSVFPSQFITNVRVHQVSLIVTSHLS